MCSVACVCGLERGRESNYFLRAFVNFVLSELIAIFLGTIRTMRMRQRSRTCEFVFIYLFFFTLCKSSWLKAWLFINNKRPCIVVFSLNNSCLEHLLDNGADPSMVNSKGYSAVHYAAYHGNKQNLELVSVLFDMSSFLISTQTFDN